MASAKTEQLRNDGWPDNKITSFWQRKLSGEGYSQNKIDAFLVREGLQIAGFIDERDQAELQRQQRVAKISPYLEKAKQAIKPYYEPILAMPQTYLEKVRSSEEMMRQPDIVSKGLGALGYAFAPLETLTATGGKITGGISREMGAPEPLAKGIEFGTEVGLDFLIPFGPAKKAGDIPKVTGRLRWPKGWLEKTEKTAEQWTIPKKEFNELLSKVRHKIGTTEGIVDKGLEENTLKTVTEAAYEALKGKYDDASRIFENVTYRLGAGEIQWGELPEILKKYDMSPEEFALLYKDTVSRSGRVLAYHSQLAKKLNKIFEKSPEAAALFEDALKETSLSDRIWAGLRSIESTRRGLLVTQVATAMRNLVSQGARLGVEVFDSALSGVFGGGKDNFKQSWNLIVGAWNRLPTGDRKLVQQILDSDVSPLDTAKLLSQPVHEATVGGKAYHFISALNRWQESFFRKLAFEAKLRQFADKNNLDFATLDPNKIPTEWLKEAVDYGLEMAFASSPKGEGLKRFIRSFSDNPILTTIQPFPRFAYANALPFLAEHSPLGFIKALFPNTLKELASGDSRKFVRGASRATTGTLMLESGLHIRNSDRAGQRWYEIKIGEPDPTTGKQRVLDMRSYAPFSSYLFIAEALTHPERLKPKDYMEAAIGLNRVSGTGLVLVDAMRGKSWTSIKDILGSFAGAYIGSYTVPVKTAKDIAAQFDKEEAIYRERELPSPLVGTALGNIPYVSKLLPESYSPITAERQRQKSPMGRQLTGIPLKDKTPLHQEIDRVGLEWNKIYPKTGIDEADSQIKKFMGVIVDSTAPQLLSNTEYLKHGPYTRKVLLGNYFRTVRQAATTTVKAQHPEWAMRIKIQAISKDEKAMLKERTGLNLDAIEPSEILNYMESVQ